MQITNYNLQQTTKLQHKGRFFNAFLIYSILSNEKQTKPTKQNGNSLKQSLPPPLFFRRRLCVNTSTEMHQESAVTNSWHCRQSVTCCCFYRSSSRTAALCFAGVLSTHACPGRQVCWSPAGAELGTAAEDAPAAKMPALWGDGLPAPRMFSAPFFGKKELLLWSSHFIKASCHSAALARCNSIEQNQEKAVSSLAGYNRASFSFGKQKEGA